MLTWSYEANPACNVLVGENSEVTAAKSTVPETNKSSSSRPKTSTASTTSSSSATHQTNRVAGEGGGGSSSSSSQPSTNAGGGGKNPILHKRNRRSVPLLQVEKSGVGSAGGGGGSEESNTVTATVSSASVISTDKPLGANDLSLHEISSAKSVTANRYAAATSFSSLHTPSISASSASSASSSSYSSAATSVDTAETTSNSAAFGNYFIDNNVKMNDEDENSGAGDVANGLNQLHANIPNTVATAPSPLLLPEPPSTDNVINGIDDDNNNGGGGNGGGLLSTNENLLNGFANVFDVTHGTNSNQDLTATATNNNSDGNETFDLITNSFDENNGFDINNNENYNGNDNDDDDSNNRTSHGYRQSNNKNDASESEIEDDMLQNDAPTIIANGQPSVEIVNLLDDGEHFHSPPEPALSLASAAPPPSSHSSPVKIDAPASSKDQIQIHTLPEPANNNNSTTKHKPIFSPDTENDINKYPYIGESYPERTYYQLHDATSSNNLTGQINNNSPINTHDQQQQMQRILVNISIATDSGAGTQNHGVYMLHVSVPAGPDFIPPLINTPVVRVADSSVNAHENIQNDNGGNTVDDERPPEIPPHPPCPCQCSDEIYSSAVNTVATSTVQTHDDEPTTKMTETSTISNAEAINETPTSNLDDISNEIDSNLNVTQSCLINQDIPTILILEGERMYLILCFLTKTAIPYDQTNHFKRIPYIT